VGGSESAVRDVSRKLQWRFLEKDELKEFRRAVRVRTEVMTVIMMTAKM
jgi:hypothetical protein